MHVQSLIFLAEKKACIHTISTGTIRISNWRVNVILSNYISCRPITNRWSVYHVDEGLIKAGSANLLDAKTSVISVSDGSSVMAVCEREQVELYARFRSEREDWVQAMVLAGIGFAFMPEYSVSLPGLMQRPLIEPQVERQIATMTVPGRRFSPGLDSFMRAANGFAWPG